MLQPQLTADVRPRVRPTQTMALSNVPLLAERCMGIDPSLTSTGLAVLEQGQLAVHRLAPSLRGVERLAWFYAEIVRHLRFYAPAVVTIEGYAFGARSHAHALGELGGVIRLALHDCGLTARVVPPTSLKLFASGSGHCEKSVISKELFKRYGVDLANNDEVDAAGLAIVGAALLAVDRPGTGLPAFQRKALQKIE